jgi:hypothetical protein
MKSVHLPFDSITDVKRVTGADLRYPAVAKGGRRVAARHSAVMCE